MDTGKGMMEGARNGRRLGLRLVGQSPQLSLTWTPTGTTKCGHEHARENLESYAVLRSARRRSVMESLHRRCAGLDVHKDTVMACVLIRESASGRKRHFAWKRKPLGRGVGGSNCIPSSEPPRPGSERLGFRRPSLPWLWSCARIPCSAVRSDSSFATQSGTSPQTESRSAANPDPSRACRRRKETTFASRLSPQRAPLSPPLRSPHKISCSVSGEFFPSGLAPLAAGVPLGVQLAARCPRARKNR